MLQGLVLLLLAAGQFELVVTLVNRLHGCRFRNSPLKILQDVHELVVILLPLAVACLVGWQGSKLLVDDGWSQLTLVWRIYLVICGLGALGMLYSAARYARRGGPTGQLSNHTQVIYVAQELGHRPIGQGPYRALARLPLNEIFELEVSEKVYRLPRLPAAWDGLSILHLTDFHFNGAIGLPFFEHLIDVARRARPDMVVFTGDLMDDMRLIDWLPSTLGRLEAPLGRYFILGNHDWYLDADEIRRQMKALGWHDLAGETIMLAHRQPPIALGGSELPWMGRHPDFSACRAAAFRILLSHTPDNLPWARRQEVDLMLSGHNHGGQVVLPLVGPVYSPSIYGCRYASGAFDLCPTMLYVSRGVSGRHPVRFLCRPELTTLVLRSAASL